MAPVIGGGVSSPFESQRAIVFVDGTNLFYRLEAAKLKMPSLSKLFPHHLQGRQLHRIYLYTVREQFERAQAVQGDGFCHGIRCVFGDGVPTGDGNVKEKGVDALLVADLVYHAAMKNYDYALVVSVDTDFAHAIRRVEAFGCKTGVLGICAEVPERLRDSCDEAFFMHAGQLQQHGFAKPA